MTVDPLTVLRDWLPGIPGEGGYFPSMGLATVDADGAPDLRTVLLSRVNSSGPVFHTDARSRKVTQLRASPVAALMLTVPERARQIVVRGPVRELVDDELFAAYESRPRYLQLLAWLNTPEMAAMPEQERRFEWADFTAVHAGRALMAPPDWCGFVVEPARMTFWQGDTEGPSHRIEYCRSDSGWTRAELPG